MKNLYKYCFSQTILELISVGFVLGMSNLRDKITYTWPHELVFLFCFSSLSIFCVIKFDLIIKSGMGTRMSVKKITRHLSSY